MKSDNLKYVPKYSDDDLPSSTYRKSNDPKEYFNETLYEPVGIFNNQQWLVMPTKKGENEMLDTTSEYGKLNLPKDFVELLKKMVANSNSNESDIVKKGLVFLGFADRVKQQGLKLAVVDDDGNILVNLEGY